jgi:hypothetical protein
MLFGENKGIHDSFTELSHRNTVGLPLHYFMGAAETDCAGNLVESTITHLPLWGSVGQLLAADEPGEFRVVTW